jgi:ABC-type transport system involved in cytochrome c biogenesis permease subunit
MLGLLVLAMYCASSAAYLIHFFRPDAAAGRWKAAIFRLTLAAHALYLATGWAGAGYPPLYDRYAILGLIVFCYSLIYLVIEARTGRPELGGFILILASVSFAVSLLSSGQTHAASANLRGPVFVFHVLNVIMAYAALFLGFLFASLYLALYYEIKRHRLGRVYDRLPSLEMLATMSRHANTLGFVFLTIGIAAGSIWSKHVDIYFGLDPKLIATAAVWAIYAGSLALAYSPGWSRKRSAYSSVFGFFTLVFSFVLLHSVVNTAHNF